MANEKAIEQLRSQVAAMAGKVAQHEAKFRTLVDRSYQNGDAAHQKMNAFLDKHGYQELLATIRADGNEFGAPPDDPGLRNDAGKYRHELYVTLAEFWKLTDQHDELKAALERLQAQQSSESGSDTALGTASGRAPDKKPATPKAAASAGSAPSKEASAGQKSPAEIQAYFAARNAERAAAKVAEARKEQQREHVDEHEPE